MRTSALSAVHFVLTFLPGKESLNGHRKLCTAVHSLRRVGMDLADATAIIIAGLFFLPVTHSGADMLETVVALSFISVTGGVSLGDPMDMLL